MMDSKKKYEMVQLDVVKFLQEDIITTSGLYYNDVNPDATLYWDEILKMIFGASNLRNIEK